MLHRHLTLLWFSQGANALVIIQTAVTLVFAPSVCLYLISVMTDCFATSPHGSLIDFQVRLLNLNNSRALTAPVLRLIFRGVAVLEYGHVSMLLVLLRVLHVGIVLDGL